MTRSPLGVSSSRWTRALPWLTVLLVGTSAQVVWWSHVLVGPVVQRVEVPARCAPPGAFLTPATATATATPQRPCAPACSRSPPSPTRAPDGVRGAVVCSGDACIIRRSFVRQVLDDPRMLSAHPWRRSTGSDGHRGLRVRGVYPGSVAEVIGLREGDMIVAVDGQPLACAESPTRLVTTLEQRDGLTLAVVRGEQHLSLRIQFVGDEPSS